MSVEDRLAIISGEAVNTNNGVIVPHKYKLVEDDRCKDNDDFVVLYRIKSLIAFNDVPANTLGGFVQSYNNLSQEGNCWIYNNARVVGGAQIKGNAQIREKARVQGNAIINDNVVIKGKSIVTDSKIKGNLIIDDEVKVWGDIELDCSNMTFNGNIEIKKSSKNDNICVTASIF